MRQAKRQGYKNNSQRGFCRELFALIHIIGAAEWSPDTEELAALSAEIVNQILVDILWGLSEPIGLGWLNSFVKRTAAGDYYFHYLRMCYFGASSIKRYNCEKKKKPFPGAESQVEMPSFDQWKVQNPETFSLSWRKTGTILVSQKLERPLPFFSQTMVQITSLAASVKGGGKTSHTHYSNKDLYQGKLCSFLLPCAHQMKIRVD